jgi:hypothetical protein
MVPMVRTLLSGNEHESNSHTNARARPDPTYVVEFSRLQCVWQGQRTGPTHQTVTKILAR